MQKMIKVTKAQFNNVLSRDDVVQCEDTLNLLVKAESQQGAVIADHIIGTETTAGYHLVQEYCRKGLPPGRQSIIMHALSLIKR